MTKEETKAVLDSLQIIMKALEAICTQMTKKVPETGKKKKFRS